MLNYNSDKQREYFLSQTSLDINQVVNILIKELHGKINQDSLWRMFGYVIFTNLQVNLSNTKICECCKERFVITNKNDYSSKYCDDCRYEKDLEKKRKWKNSQK